MYRHWALPVANEVYNKLTTLEEGQSIESLKKSVPASFSPAKSRK